MSWPLQDTIKGGTRGTRQQCTAAARRALAAGSNVIIDRTNFDASQRADFATVAQQFGVQVTVDGNGPLLLHTLVTTCGHARSLLQTPICHECTKLLMIGAIWRRLMSWC